MFRKASFTDLLQKRITNDTENIVGTYGLTPKRSISFEARYIANFRNVLSAV
ncbi:hypothetical protein VCRA2119O147_3300002 [Vibrio crassostreae]|nr:hypothetical protein VCRA2118O236_470001 [Vibrio crassostreae]CAK2121878.1 hypothetical protein VCRA2110O181_430001 [Vibrio crassostreae]CAK2122268.1 hypothetical protein VCRA2113O198_440018 [Vibrio crassostreae]CAK2124663.1 hypothetical protein VCRA2113O204_440016 [Vibrio crassostreae]CAK2125908.1 hypothetical protein VCRA2110O177_470010 [Vibrio crassostreae]